MNRLSTLRQQAIIARGILIATECGLIITPLVIMPHSPHLWYCAACGAWQELEDYDPQAPLVSLVCDMCGNEIKDYCVADIDNIKYWPEYFRAAGQQGGKKTSLKYGKEHYRRLADNMNKKKKA